MYSNRLIAGVIIAAGFWSTGVLAAHGEHWSYSGTTGPDHWAELSADYESCGAGHNQSPIDLGVAADADQAEVIFHYMSTPLRVTNNGHSIQVDYAKGSYIEVGGHRYDLKQFHFHSPSEHEVDGRSFPMEGHLVHADADGNLAVIGVFFEPGGENDTIRSVWKHLPAKAGETEQVDGETVNAAGLLPEDHSAWRYNGSLTTPPCSEGVTWLVMKKPVTVSAERIARFHDLMGVDNNRPVQPLNARVVIE
jgi:carbonic anhydrase